MTKPSLKALFVFLFVLPTFAFAQWADTSVDVGPGHAGATADANGEIWSFGDTTSHVDGNGSFASGVAIGVGHDGISFSHSVGANGGGMGVGHNINMTIGRDGTHVSQGGVTTQGGNTRVEAGGGSGRYGGGLRGGSNVRGWGNNTNAWSNSNTQRFPRVLGRFIP